MTARDALLLLVGSWPLLCGAQEGIADIRQGTNLALSLAPDGQTLVVDLLGQLWQLPVAGGGAQALTSSGEIARNPRHSPSGNEIVYQRLNGEQWDLWLLNLATGTSVALTDTPYNEREPDFTAGGSSVIFASDQTGHYCLWRRDVASGVLTQLTEEPGDASFPTVSEFGQIAYVLDRHGQFALRALNSSVGTELVTSRNPLGSPSWRPGGGVLVFAEQETPRSNVLKMLLLTDPPVIKPMSSGEDIFRVRAAWASAAEFFYAADGQIWRRGIADATRHPVQLFAAVAVEAYSPPSDLPMLDAEGPHEALGINGLASTADGRRTVFTALGDLWLLDRGDLTQLTDDAYVEMDPTLAPDGESVIFVSDRAGPMNLWRISLPSRQLIQLTFDATKPFRPAISPEGRRLAFLDTDGLGPWSPSKLRLLDLGTTGTLETLAEGLINAQAPIWEPGGRTLAVIAETPTSKGSSLRRYDLTTGLEISGGAAPSAAPAMTESRNETLAALDLRWTAAPPPEPYVVQVGRLFDGVRAEYRRHVDIHVERGRIAAIVGRGVRPLPAKVIDARDATVIPGLIDIHAHQSAVAGERLGRAWLSYGVTTVREITADLNEALERGEAWSSGRRAGPHLVITPGWDFGQVAKATSAGAAVPVREYPGLADGFGHSLLKQARELGIPATPSQPYEKFFTIGSGPHYEMEVSPLHSSYQDSLSRVVASGTVTGSALSAMRGLSSRPARTHLGSVDLTYETLFTAVEQQHWANAGLFPESVPALAQTIARLIRAGGRVAIGTDAPALPYGLAVHLEMALLAEAGIPNDQILRLATAEGAISLGLEQQIGTLENGKLADFVVLSGDPLVRITDSQTITAIVKGGVWHDRLALSAGP